MASRTPGRSDPGTTAADTSTEPGPRPARARFLQLADVCQILDISASQTYALVRSGELPAIKIGGRGQWRVEFSELEAFIARMYDETRTFVATHPFGSTEEWSEEDGASRPNSAGSGSGVASVSAVPSAAMVESA